MPIYGLDEQLHGCPYTGEDLQRSKQQGVLKITAPILRNTLTRRQINEPHGCHSAVFVLFYDHPAANRIHCDNG